MTREQIIEAEKILPLLNQCREHLDNARYRMGATNPSDPQMCKCDTAYDYICRVLDEF